MAAPVQSLGRKAQGGCVNNRRSIPARPHENSIATDGLAVQFGPVIERVVNARSEGKGNDAIDLADGKLVDLPKDFCQLAGRKATTIGARRTMSICSYD